MKEVIISDEELEVDPRGWAWISFDANSGEVLAIVARESDGYDFDLYIVHEEDVTEDKFWSEHALFTRSCETYYRGDYKFKKSGSYCLVIGNHRALSVIREVYVKLVLKRVDEKDQKALEKKRKKESKQTVKESKKREASVDLPVIPQSTTPSFSQLSWKGVIILIAILCILIVVAFALWFVHPFLGGAVLTVGVGLLFSVGRKDVRKLLGIANDE